MNVEKRFLKSMFVSLLFALSWVTTACQSPPETTDAAVAETVAVAVAATLQSEGVTETVNEGAQPAPATWTPLPAVNVDTPTPDATLPPPPTSSPLPTDTPSEPTNTPAPPTETPQPTATAVPATNTPVPAAAQPTQPPPPPPEPTVPPNPVVGGNILSNGSFEDGWYNLNGIPELQLPNNWGFDWDEGATGFGSEEWDVWVRPETRVLPNYQLPASERSRFVRDGTYTIKMFKGNGAISFRLFQDVTLQPGTYVFQVNAFPDLVSGYDNGRKVWAGDPLSGEIRFITPDGGTGWLLPAVGQWNTLEHTFTLAEAQTVRIGIGVRGRYALSNNGWFFDQWTLRPIQ